MDQPFRVGRIWYIRYPMTLHFAPFLSRQPARDARAAYLRSQKTRTTTALAGNLLPAMGTPLPRSS